MKVRLGFVPLTDCAPLAAADALGCFAHEGLEVELSREASWATLREKLAVGALDGAHLLAPMALAASDGCGSEPTEIIVPMALATGGAAVTLSARIAARTGADPAEALQALVEHRRAAGASVLTFAVVFPYSIQAYLLRTWLERAGIDPDKDVRLTVAPPPRMVELLAGGVIEGFCAGEPWNAAAEAAGAGRIAVRAADVWGPRAPDKVLAVGERWAEAEPTRLPALIRALARGAGWADAPANRAELTRLLAEPRWVGVAPELIAHGLSHIVFHRDDVGRPRLEDAIWLVQEMRRWGQCGASSDMDDGLARRVYRPDLYEAAMLAAPDI